MSQLQKFKASKPCPAYKVRRARRELAQRVREQVEFDNDCSIAYAAMFERVLTHNVTRLAFAPSRDSPVVH